MIVNQMKEDSSCKSESGKTKCYIVVSDEVLFHIFKMKMKLF